MSRNAHALALILTKHCTELPSWRLAKLAQDAAADGALAVDSLTDEQADRLMHDDATMPFDGDALRAALRRCATGEGER